MSDRLNPLEDLGDLFVNRDEELEKFGSSGICSKHDANSSDETSLSKG